MKYVLTQLISGHPQFVEISKEQYEAIASSRKCLLECLYIEQKFDLLVENYLDYEISLLSSSASYMIFRNQDYYWFQFERMKAIRKIFNLLSTCRLYFDQTSINISNIYKEKDKSIISKLKQFKKNEYDKYSSYRIMEQLRNHIQHNDLPIGISYPIKRIETKYKDKLLFILKIFINIDKLENDKELKKSVLDEIKALGKNNDLHHLIKEYIESISRIQDQLRKSIRSDIEKWENVIEQAIILYKANTHYEDSMVGLSIGVKNEDGTIDGSHYIFTGLIEYRKKLEQKNKVLHSLPNRIISDDDLSLDT